MKRRWKTGKGVEVSLALFHVHVEISHIFPPIRFCTWDLTYIKKKYMKSTGIVIFLHALIATSVCIN